MGDNEKDFDKRSETRSVLQLYNDMDSVKDSSKSISFTYIMGLFIIFSEYS